MSTIINTRAAGKILRLVKDRTGLSPFSVSIYDYAVTIMYHYNSRLAVFLSGTRLRHSIDTSGFLVFESKKIRIVLT